METEEVENKLTISRGSPSPFGVIVNDDGVNFSLYSCLATDVTLCLFSFHDHQPIAEFALDPSENKTSEVWHIKIQGLPEQVCYAYRLNKRTGRMYKGFFKKENLILDPYTKGVESPSSEDSCDIDYQPLGVIPTTQAFDWEGDTPPNIPRNDLVIYEMHVRGFTRHPSSNVSHPGTYLGVVEKIPHLLELGINAVKLMPVQEFNPCEYSRYNPFTGAPLQNYWGYSTVSFFSPMNRYSSGNKHQDSIREFQTMVKELHRHGIEVILDIVLNHTAEGNENGPYYSFKGIDPKTYYLMDHQHFMDFTGCGNTLNCNQPVVREFIRDCLRYWIIDMHVDGFRFDLGGVFMRGTKGEVCQHSSLIEELSNDPIFASAKLIAEPWDAKGLYQLGGFYPEQDRWSEWNDKYRDSVRRFIKGDRGEKREFAKRICGSDDLFHRRSPLASINFITAHDGFTLYDVVSYNQKNNSANAEDNRDGHNANMSWNCGFEGETENEEVLSLRQRQMKNFHLALMISQGIPMLLMSDEYGHTRYGNNNAWCQDNDLNWFLWDKLEHNESFYRFCRMMIRFRKSHEVFRLGRFLTEDEIDWHCTKPFEPDWEGDTQMIAFTLKESQKAYQIYVAFNMHHTPLTLQLPPPMKQPWKQIIDTGRESPNDFYEESDAPTVESDNWTLQPHSSILLKSV